MPFLSKLLFIKKANWLNFFSIFTKIPMLFVLLHKSKKIIKMIDFTDTEIAQIAVHKIGNKLNDEGIRFSKAPVKSNEELNVVLLKYFLNPFKSEELYNLWHDTDLKYNEVYSYVSEIFDDPDSFFDQSINLAKHLYEQSTHPKIKPGEFYVVYLRDCIVEGNVCDAIGIFKSENKDTFLKVLPTPDSFNLMHEEGININKLDKGCLIFNCEKDKGFLVSVLDNSGKGNEALYWVDDFLHVRTRKDSFHDTSNILTLCKKFVVEKLPDEFNVSKADQSDLLNKSVKFFKENESFSMDDYKAEVIQRPEVIKAFDNYKQHYSEERDIQIADEFDISAQAVKKQQRIFKSVIKLDKNFHIYVHGNKDMIEKGYDPEAGMHYYKVFFKEEN